MLTPSVEAVRLSLHVLAAAVWVGGQFTLASMVPPARKISDDATGVLARGFARMAWPAYAVLVITGFWNIAATHPSKQSTAWQAVLWCKIAVVALAGGATLLHQRARSRGAIAAWGSVAGLSSTAALIMGVLLAG